MKLTDKERVYLAGYAKIINERCVSFSAVALTGGRMGTLSFGYPQGHTAIISLAAVKADGYPSQWRIAVGGGSNSWHKDPAAALSKSEAGLAYLLTLLTIPQSAART